MDRNELSEQVWFMLLFWHGPSEFRQVNKSGLHYNFTMDHIELRQMNKSGLCYNFVMDWMNWVNKSGLFYNLGILWLCV